MRQFEPGEGVWSVVWIAEGALRRQDRCLACGLPEGLEPLSYWRTRAPEPRSQAEAPPEEIEEFFARLASRPDRDERAERVLYLVGLWLVRKRRLRVAGRRAGPPPVLLMERTCDGEQWEVREPAIPQEEWNATVEEVARVLGVRVERADENAPEVES
jgi:hypothetical protein